MKKVKRIISLAAAGIITLTTAAYSAENTVTRRELLEDIVSAAKIYPIIYDNSFSDVSSADMYADILAGAAAAGAVDADIAPEGKFRPDDGVTREEAVSMIVKALLYMKADFPVCEKQLSFSDRDNISPRLLPYIEAAAACGLISDGGEFDPKGGITETEKNTLIGKIDEIYSSLPLHIGSPDTDGRLNEVRELLPGAIPAAKEYFDDGMKRIIQNNSQSEVDRGLEEIELAYGAVYTERSSIMTGSYIYDDNGGLIQAHGGNVIWDEISQKYYWYGEARKTSALPEHLQKYGDWGWRTGVGCYSSDDLYNWKYEGLALEMLEEGDGLEYPQSDIGLGRVIERPKVIYNEKTGKYVMWMHIDNGSYGYSRAGVAVSDSPIGPFEYLGSYRPGDKMSRDMTVYADDDGSGYIYFSTDENGSLACCRLSDDYLTCEGEAVYCISWKWREAPAVFKYEGTYYMITSGCTGWAANTADYASAPSPTGPWTQHGNPCVGVGADKTFGGQSYWVLPVDAEKGQFIFMADIWRPDHHSESGYIWLPIQMQPDGGMRIEWTDEWAIEDLNNKVIEPEAIYTVYGEEKAELPKTVPVIKRDKEYSEAVQWDSSVPSLPGHYSISGTVGGFNNSPVSMQVYNIPKNVVYFADCGADDQSEYNVVKALGNALLNSGTDQAYGKDPVTGKTWGYVNDNDVGHKNDTQMFRSVRYDYSEGGSKNVGKGITYKFEVSRNKKYSVYVGVFDPWNENNRCIDVKIQDKTVADGYNTHDGSAVFSLENVISETGEISVASLRDGKSLEEQLDPIISWIMITEAE